MGGWTLNLYVRIHLCSKLDMLGRVLKDKLKEYSLYGEGDPVNTPFWLL